MSIRHLSGDCRAILPTLPAESVHCCITSPPYYALRDYQVTGQIGLEATPEAYVAELVGVFREVRRVLRRDGTCWVNLGDSYSNAGTRQGDRDGVATTVNEHRMVGNGYRSRIEGLKNKDLIGIPWMVAFALRADGWYLRSDIIWSKPNPMPESVTDRPTKAHEYLFLLSRSARYFYDAEAIKEPGSDNSHGGTPIEGGPKQILLGQQIGGRMGIPADANGRNRRSVWTVATQPFSNAHFATFPPALIEPCIKAGVPERCCARCGAPWMRQTEISYSDAHRGMVGNQRKIITDDRVMHAGRENDKRLNKNVSTLGFSPSCACEAGTVPGTVLDPFGGAGTTGLVADRLQRNAILIELSDAYAGMASSRIADDRGPLLALMEGP